MSLRMLWLRKRKYPLMRNLSPNLDQSLTIGLDARCLHRPNRRGIGKNLAELCEHVLRARPQWRIIGYCRDRSSVDLFSGPGYQAKVVDCPGDRFHAWERWRLPLAAWRDGVDLLHCPANTCPTWNPTPTVLTVHDLMPMEQSAFDAHRFRQSIDHAVRSHLPIVTPSAYTATQLQKRFNASDGQVTVIPWAADSSTKYVAPSPTRSRVLARYGVSEPFIIHLGATDPRKNTQAVIRAFSAVAPIVRDHWKLLVIGVDDPQWREELETQAQALGCRDRVQLHAFAPQEDMAALFSAAGILAYPSKAEGFGLPILDAWATQTAVLTSSVTSLPEVAGDAAMMVDPFDLCSIARGMGKLMAEVRLRADIVRRGSARLANFTWAATADRFVNVIERSVAKREGLRLAA